MAVEIDAIQSAKSIGWTDALLSRLAANSVGLAARLSITAPANASALSASGYSLTGSNASSMIDLAGTWNTSGNPVALKMAITNTASGATSKFISCLAGASGTTEVFSVNKAGVVAVGNAANGARISFTASSIASYNSGPGELLLIGTENTASILMGFNPAVAKEVLLDSASVFGWCSGTVAAGTLDTKLYRDAANTLALRNAANAQAFNIYNTYTSGSVYERGFMRWVSNVLEIGTEHVGASARDLVLKYNNVETARVTNLQLSITGSVLASSYVRGSYLRLGASDHLHMYTAGNGVVTLYNTAENDFDRLQFGGVSSSFPALKRSSTILQSRLADDSDFAPLQGRLRSHANATSETPTATHTLRLFDAAGTEYRVLAIAV